jgi:hypothetical protein
MIRKQEAFFDFSNDARNSITSLFDLLWSLDVGLWNLREDVKKDKTDFPKLTEEDLGRKYAKPSGVHGTNFIRSCLKTSWEDQQTEIAWLLLASTCSIFEGWTENLTKTFTKIDPAKMQFPKSARKEIQKYPNLSQFMMDYFYSPYRDSKTPGTKRNITHIEGMLYYYRVFKEIRNCYIHKNRICDNTVVQAYQNFLPYKSPKLLDINEEPQIAAPVQGIALKPNIRDVVSFSEVVQNVILTIDAELLKTNEAYSWFIGQFERSPWSHFTKENKLAFQTKNIKSFLMENGFKTPAKENMFYSAVIAQRLADLSSH